MKTEEEINKLIKEYEYYNNIIKEMNKNKEYNYYDIFKEARDDCEAGIREIRKQEERRRKGLRKNI